MSDNQKTKKKHLIIFGLVSLLAVLLCLAAVLATAFSLITEGVYEFEEEPVPSMSELPQNTSQALSYIKGLAAAATDDTHVFVKTSATARIDEQSIVTDAAQPLRDVLLYMK